MSIKRRIMLVPICAFIAISLGACSSSDTTRTGAPAGLKPNPANTATTASDGSMVVPGPSVKRDSGGALSNVSPSAMKPD